MALDGVAGRLPSPTGAYSCPPPPPPYPTLTPPQPYPSFTAFPFRVRVNRVRLEQRSPVDDTTRASVGRVAAPGGGAQRRPPVGRHWHLIIFWRNLIDAGHETVSNGGGVDDSWMMAAVIQLGGEGWGEGGEFLRSVIHPAAMFHKCIGCASARREG